MNKILIALGALLISAASVNGQGMSEKKSTDTGYLGTYALYLENNRSEAFRLFQGDTTRKDTAWKFGGLVGVNVSQAAFINWAAGGQNSISYTLLGNAFARYEKGNSLWVNSLELAYGQTRLGDGGKFQKTDDRIELTSKYGQKMSKTLYGTAMANFRTQFDRGYNYPNDSVTISQFMSPGYLTIALGVDYVPNSNFSVLMSPVASKMTFVMNQRMADAGQFGVEPAMFNEVGDKTADGENFRFELGASLTAMYNTKLWKESVAFSTKLQLFSNYLDRPGNIDVNWEALVSFKVNDFLNASIGTLLIYDHDIKIQKKEDGVITSGPRTQFKEVLSIGLAYTIK